MVGVSALFNLEFFLRNFLAGTRLGRIRCSEAKFSHFRRAFDDHFDFLRLALQISDHLLVQLVLCKDFLLYLQLVPGEIPNKISFVVSNFSLPYLRNFSSAKICFFAISWLREAARSNSLRRTRSLCCWISFNRLLYFSMTLINLRKALSPYHANPKTNIISLHLSLTFLLQLSALQRFQHAFVLHRIRCWCATATFLIHFAQLLVLLVDLLEHTTRNLNSVTVQVVGVRLSRFDSFNFSLHAMQIFAIIVYILQRTNDIVTIRDEVVSTQMLWRDKMGIERKRSDFDGWFVMQMSLTSRWALRMKNVIRLGSWRELYSVGVSRISGSANVKSFGCAVFQSWKESKRWKKSNEKGFFFSPIFRFCNSCTESYSSASVGREAWSADDSDI